MTPPSDLGEAIAAWAKTEVSVSGLVLIGSRQRSADEVIDQADSNSDWDYHVISSRPEMFGTRDWANRVPGVRLLAHCARSAVIGGVPKINMVFSEGEADFVVIPSARLRVLKLLVALGFHRRAGRIRSRVQDIAEVVRPGWRFVKGEQEWGAIYRKAVEEVSDPHLDDEAVRRLSDGFVCDYVWTLRKIARGEHLAAQRMIYRELAEVNFQLLHELRQRRNERTFTKARRIERVATAGEIESVSVNASPDAASLKAALAKCAATCRDLTFQLVGGSWRWPDVR